MGGAELIVQVHLNVQFHRNPNRLLLLMIVLEENLTGYMRVLLREKSFFFER
jgi:hypothetical protein